MRKASAIVFTLIYFLMTVGVAVNTHYCNDRLLESYAYAKPQCHSCDYNQQSPEDCCDDKTEYFSVEDYHSIASFNFSVTTLVAKVFQPVFNQTEPVEDQTDQTVPSDYSLPPPLPDFQILFCQLSIYG